MGGELASRPLLLIVKIIESRWTLKILYLGVGRMNRRPDALLLSGAMMVEKLSSPPPLFLIEVEGDTTGVRELEHRIDRFDSRCFCRLSFAKNRFLHVTIFL